MTATLGAFGRIRVALLLFDSEHGMVAEFMSRVLSDERVVRRAAHEGPMTAIRERMLSDSSSYLELDVAS